MTSAVQPDFGHTETKNAAKEAAVPRKRQRWTEDEIAGWSAYMRGEIDAPPSARPGLTVIKKCEIPRPKDITRERWHRSFCALRPFLDRIPYKTGGERTDFIERVQKGALDPYCTFINRKDELFCSAVVAARKALWANG